MEQNTNESVDYPDHVHPVAEQVSKNTTDLGHYMWER